MPGSKSDSKKTKNELIYRVFFELSPSGILLEDEKGYIIDVNSALCGSLGYSRKEFLKMRVHDLVLPENCGEVDKNIKKVLKGGILKHVVQNLRKDGSICYMELNETKIKLPDGRNSILVIADDITERRNFEESLKSSEQRYRTLFESANDAIFLMDGEKFIECNSKTLSMFGCSKKQIINQPPYKFSPPRQPDGRDSHEKALEKINSALNGEPQFFEWRHWRLDKTPFDAEVSLKKIIISKKNYLQAIVRDITARKQAEEQIKKYNEELRLLNSSKDKFFSILAHDLKSPFTSLLGYSDLIVNDIIELEIDEIKDAVKHMNKVSKHIYSLLENLLEWSRIQTGHIEYSARKVILYDVIQSVYDLVQSYASRKRIKMINKVPKNLEIFVDENIIFTIMRNLISNAIKFTHEDGTLTVTAERGDEFVTVCVKDNGIGMDKQELSKLFRIDVHQTGLGTHKETGTGLGLILCKEHIEKSGGKLWVESKKDKGSKFFFTVPKTSNKKD